MRDEKKTKNQLIHELRALRARNQALEAEKLNHGRANGKLSVQGWKIAPGETDAKFGTIFENAPVMIMAHNDKGEFQLWNKECERSLGWTLQEVNRSEDPLALFFPGQEERTMAVDSVMKADGQFREHRVRAKDGSVRTQMWAGFQLPNDGFISVGHDITELKRIENALRESNQRLDLLAETASMLLESDSPQEVINSLCRKVLSFLNCDAFFNYLVDYERQRLHLNACCGIPEKDVQKMEWLDYGVGLCGCSARDGKRLVVENLQDIDDQYTALVRPFGIQAYACHPLISQGRVLGTLSFCSRHKSRFSEDELSIMKSVADQVAIAIDRKLASERIARSENKFREIFENACDAIFLLGEDFSILDCNAAATDLFRCEMREIAGKPLLDFTPSVQQDRSDSRQKSIDIRNSLLQGHALCFEWLCQRQDGTQFEALLVANSFTLGGEVRIRATVRDISERKRAEAALRESEERFRVFMDNSPAIVWMKDGDGRYVYLNKSYERRFDVPLAEFKGKTDFEVWPHHIAKQFRDNDLVVMNSGKPMEITEECINPKGDHSFWWTSKFLIQDSTGRYYVVGIGIDITRHKELENELRASEHRFRALVEATSDCIWEVDENEIYTYVSPKVYDYLGFKPPQVIGKSFYEFVTPEQAINLRSKLDAYKANRKPFFVLEKESRHKNGNIVIIETSGVPIFDKDGNFAGYRGVDRNITERKLLEQKFLQAQKMEVVGQLASGIAHDFNNIIMAIKGYMDILLPRIKDDAECTQYMKRMVALAERAKTLTRDLLSFSRKEGIQPKPYDLNSIIRNMRNILTWLIGDGIRFKLSPHQVVLPIMSVPGQIEQVLINLVTNARDATPKGGLITVSTSFVASDCVLFKPEEYADVHGFALLSVADTGSGMDDATRLKIFEPFFTLKEVGKGTGLGLAVVYGVIKHHGGFINVDSRQGMGTTFNIYIPLIDEEHPDIEEGA